MIVSEIKLYQLLKAKLATKQDFKELEMRIIIKLGTMMAASIAITVSLVKLL